jgi:hypothetical protein
MRRLGNFSNQTFTLIVNGETIFGPCGLGNAIGCASASEEGLNERRKFPAPAIYSGPEQRGEHSPANEPFLLLVA